MKPTQNTQGRLWVSFTGSHNFSFLWSASIAHSALVAGISDSQCNPTANSTVQRNFYILAYCRAYACCGKGRIQFPGRL